MENGVIEFDIFTQFYETVQKQCYSRQRKYQEERVRPEV